MLIDIKDVHTGLLGGSVTQLHLACQPEGCSGTVLVVARYNARGLASTGRLLALPGPKAQALADELRQAALDHTPDPPGLVKIVSSDDYRDIDVEITWQTRLATFHLSKGSLELRGGRTCRFTTRATAQAIKAYERFSAELGVSKLLESAWRSAEAQKPASR